MDLGIKRVLLKIADKVYGLRNKDDSMIDNNYYVYKKEVNWSVLQQDVSIPVKLYR
jgi:hypothetical protein